MYDDIPRVTPAELACRGLAEAAAYRQPLELEGEDEQQYQGDPHVRQRTDKVQADADEGVEGAVAPPGCEGPQDVADDEADDIGGQHEAQGPQDRLADQGKYRVRKVGIRDPELPMDQCPQVVDVLLKDVTARYTQHQADGTHLGRVDRLILANEPPYNILSGIARLQSRNDEVQGDCSPQRQQEKYEPSDVVAHSGFLSESGGGISHSPTRKLTTRPHESSKAEGVHGLSAHPPGWLLAQTLPQVSNDEQDIAGHGIRIASIRPAYCSLSAELEPVRAIPERYVREMLVAVLDQLRHSSLLLVRG